jgi:hypothetical protein
LVPSDRVEVVRASRFEEVQAERDEFREAHLALLRRGDALRAELEREREDARNLHIAHMAAAEAQVADLERAQEALRELAEAVAVPGPTPDRMYGLALEALAEARERGTE